MGKCFQLPIKTAGNNTKKRTIRSISNVAYNHPTSSLFKSLAIPRLNDIFNISLGIFMFQNSKNELPPPLQKLFTPNTNVHTYLRDTEIIHTSNTGPVILYQRCLCIKDRSCGLNYRQISRR